MARKIAKLWLLLVATRSVECLAQAPFGIPTKGTITQLFLEENPTCCADVPYYDENNNFVASAGKRYHRGVDIAGSSNINNTDLVVAPGPGKVVYLDDTWSGSADGDYGHFVVIYHGIINSKHVYSFFLHMGDRAGGGRSFIIARVGQDVVPGTPIGRQGNSGQATGIHLHWEIRVSSAALTTNDSLIWNSNRIAATTVASPDYYTGACLTSRSCTPPTSVNAVQCPTRQALQSRWHPNGTLISDGSTVWLLENGRKRGIPSPEVFDSYKFDWCQVIKVSSEELQCFEPDTNLGSPPQPRLLRSNISSTVFLITDKGFRRGFNSAAVFEGLGYRWEDVSVVSDAQLGQYPDDPAAPILYSPFADGSLIKFNNDIYVITDGIKRWITSPTVFDKLAYNWNSVVQVPQQIFESIPAQPSIDEGMISQCRPGNLLPPRVDITMSKSTYVEGDTITASEFRVRNPNSSAVAARIRVWANIPTVGEYTIFDLGSDGSLLMPANHDKNLAPIPMVTVTSTFPPRGTWGLNSRVTNPTTGAVLSEDLNPFEVQDALSITSISPNQVTKNAAYTFTLTGTGFQSGFTATLINEAGQQFNIPQKEFVSSTTIRVTAFIGSGPTSTQKIRITNPNGQTDEISFTALTDAVAISWEFNTNGNPEGWSATNMSSTLVSGGKFFLDPAGVDPYISSPLISASAASYKYVKLNMGSNLLDGNGWIYFKTQTENSYAEDKKVYFSVNYCPLCGTAPWYDYSVYVGGHSKWVGTITGIRVDPGDSGRSGTNLDSVGVDYIRLTPP